MARVLLLLPTTTYRTKAFLEAAARLGVEIVAASERPSTLESTNPGGLITLDFVDPEQAAARTAEFGKQYPIDAVIPVDEDTAVVAASVARALNLRHNPVEAAEAARNKHRQRALLKQAGVRVPRYWPFTLDQDAIEIARRVTYPCVIKPVFLSTSRGVMRADNEEEFAAAVRRLEGILKLPEVQKRGRAASREALVEEFIPGFEVAVEGLLSDGELRVLAIFDKPDPLDGPFFEETIYVTPSRLSESVQTQIAETTAAATRAMKLARGPVHAELRINDEGAWIIEVAARAIGGLCSGALRFGDSNSGGNISGSNISLEELILKHALGGDVAQVKREDRAAGVMMIPIPRAGTLKEVAGLDRAKSVPDVEDVIISAHITQKLLPPPEGASYLGFIFSRAETPDRAEAALREAHSRLQFIIES